MKDYTLRIFSISLILLASCLALSAFKSEKAKYSPKNSTYSTDTKTYSPTRRAYNPHARQNVIATVDGIPFTGDYSVLDGHRSGYIPLALPVGTKISFSSQLQDIIGDEVANITDGGTGGGGKQKLTWTAPKAEMLLTMTDYTTGIITTEPGTKDVSCSISWAPYSVIEGGIHRAKLVIHWTLESSRKNPRTGKLYKDYGISRYDMNMTSEKGGWYTCRQSIGKTVQKKYRYSGFSDSTVTLEEYLIQGNFVIAMPEEYLATWNETPEYGYFTGFNVFRDPERFIAADRDTKTPKKSKPYPIDEKFFEKYSFTAVKLPNGEPFNVTTMEKYILTRLEVVNGTARFVSSTAPRLNPYHSGTYQDLLDNPYDTIKVTVPDPKKKGKFKSVSVDVHNNIIHHNDPNKKDENTEASIHTGWEFEDSWSSWPLDLTDEYVEDLNFPVISPVVETYDLRWDWDRRNTKKKN